MPSKILTIIVLAVALTGCSSATYYSEASSDRRIVYGVDGNGHALYRRPGQPPPRASAAQACVWGSAGCPEDAEDQLAKNLNER